MRTSSTSRHLRARALAVTGILAMLAGITLGAMAPAGADDEPLETATTEVTEVTTPVDPPADPPPESPAVDPLADPPPESPAVDPPATTDITQAAALSTQPDGLVSASSGDLGAKPATAGCTNNGNGTWTCPLNSGNVGATNPGFSTVTPLAACLNGLDQPDGPNNWAWHFIAPGNNNFISLTATFQNAGVVGPVVPVDGVNSDPDFSHLFLFTGPNDQLLDATAVVDSDLPGDHFQLSHVCAGTTDAATGSLEVEKAFDGNGVPDGALAWTVTVTCTDPVFQTTLSFDPNDLGPKTVSGIPLDDQDTNSCSVSETNKGTTPAGWSLVVSYDPADGANDNSASQTVDDEESPSFTVTNSYSEVGGETTVSLSVEKAIQGDDPQVGTTYVVHVTCTGDATFDKDLTFTYPDLDAQSVVLEPDANIPPDGSVKCTVAETEGGVLLGYQINGGTLQDAVVDLELNTEQTKAWVVTVVNDPGHTEVSGAVASQTLPFTGGRGGWLLPVGALLVAAGASLLLVTRRVLPTPAR